MKKLYISVFYVICWVSCTSAQVAVIAHKSVPVAEIKKSQLMDYYTGDIRSWSSGEPIVVFDLKPKGEVKDIFYKYLGKSPSRMKSIWLKRMLSGEGDPPKALKSEQEMIEKIASTPGAIGFISNAKVNEKVKVLVNIEKGKE